MLHKLNLYSTLKSQHQNDLMIYHLYELTFDEACVIDSGLSLGDFEKKLNLRNYGKKQ